MEAERIQAELRVEREKNLQLTEDNKKLAEDLKRMYDLEKELRQEIALLQVCPFSQMSVCVHTHVRMQRACKLPSVLLRLSRSITLHSHKLSWHPESMTLLSEMIMLQLSSLEGDKKRHPRLRSSFLCVYRQR